MGFSHWLWILLGKSWDKRPSLCLHSGVKGVPTCVSLKAFQTDLARSPRFPFLLLILQILAILVPLLLNMEFRNCAKILSYCESVWNCIWGNWVTNFLYYVSFSNVSKWHSLPLLLLYYILQFRFSPFSLKICTLENY